LKLYIDSTEAFDERSMAALIILHVSASPDLIDHSILLKRLEISKENAVTWVKAYLYDRSQCLDFGLTQGSV